MPNCSSKSFENKTVEIGLNISSLEASKQQKNKRKERHKSSAITLDDLASCGPIENITKLESNNAVELSLLETNGSVYLFEGIASEQKRLVGRQDDLSKDEVGTSNVLPSKVVESSTGSQTRKEERSDGKPDTSRLVHDASLPTDAQSKTYKLKGTHGLLGRQKVKKSKKRKKNGGEGADKFHAAKIGEGPDTMRKDVAAFDNTKITMDRELDGMNKLTDDTKLLSSQREGALYSIEKAGVNEEVVAPLKSVELKLTDSGNTSKKMKASKKSKPSEKDVDDFINEGHVVQQSLVPDIMHNIVTSLISETCMCERESDNKTTDEEEIKESGETEGLKSAFEGGISKKDDLQRNEVSALNALHSKAVQNSTVSETTTKERRFVDRDTTCQVHDVSSVSTDAPAKTVTAEGTLELLAQLKVLSGDGKVLGGILNQESLDHSAEVISGSGAKMSKKRKKGGVDGVDKIHAVRLDDGSDSVRKDVAAFDNERFSLERKLEGTSSVEGFTPLKLTNGSQLILSQHEVALCSVESAQVKFEDVAPLKSLELKITESGNTSKKSKSSKKTKKANDTNGGHATLLGHVPDIVQDVATFICERESENKRTGDREINEPGETNGFCEGKVRREDDKQKDIVSASNVRSSQVVESSTAGETAENERIYGDHNTTGDDAPEKTVAAKETPELLCQIIGTGKILDDILNQESLVHNANAEAKSGARVKVSKKRKKGGVDGVDKTPASKLDRGSDIIRKDVPTDAPEKTVAAKGAPELLCQLEGSILNLESVIPNPEVISGSQVKKTKKSKKSGGDGNEKIPASKLGEGSDIMRKDVAAFDCEKITMERELDGINIPEGLTPLKLTEDSQLLLSQREAALCSVESMSVNEEGVASLKSLELETMGSGNIAKKTKKPNENDVDGADVPDESHAAQLNQVPDVMQTSVSSLINETFICERDSDNRNTIEEELNEAVDTVKKRKPRTIKTSATTKQDLSNLMDSDVQELGGSSQDVVETSQPAGTSKPEQSADVRNKPKTRSSRKQELVNGKMKEVAASKTVVEQADDVMLNSNVKDNENQGNGLLSKKCHNGLTEAKKLDKQQASNVKAKKLNLSSSVDTSCNGHDLVTSEKGEGNVRVGSELQNGDHESEPLSQIGTKHLKVLETHPISQHEEHLDLQNVTEKRTTKKMPKFSASGLYEVHVKSKEENLTVSNKKSGTGKCSLVQKSIIERDHGRKHQSSTNQSSSLKEEMGAQVPFGGPVNSRATALGQNGSKASGTSSPIPAISPKTNLSGKNTKEVQKTNSQEREFRTPSIKERPVSALPLKKSVSVRSGVLFGGLCSDSSDDEVERGGSSASTRTPDDLSSSDYYSEGESKGEVVTSPQNSEGGGTARDKRNFNLSALKNMDLESVLRSSRRYKKAKLVASQSQLEDGESEPPDSQA